MAKNYQTGALTEEQCHLIAKALLYMNVHLMSEGRGIAKELFLMFNEPEKHLILLDEE